MQEQELAGPRRRSGLAALQRRLIGAVAAAAWLVDATVPVSRAADPHAASQPPAAFQPGDISIGEPIALPFAQPTTDSPGGPRAVASPRAATAEPSAPGWLGMSVAESTSPGRWTIVDVTPAGPAAASGILAGDELRTVNGRPLASGDDVSAALTAITAGQRVRLGVARADRVSDVDVLAMPRPSTSPAAAPPPTDRAVVPPDAALSGPGWQSSGPASAPPATAAPDGVATVSVLTNPPLASPPLASPSLTTSPPAALPQVPPAIPATTMASTGPVADVAPSVPRGRTALGVRTVPIDRGIQERFHLPQPVGAYVIGVVGDLPASKAGIPPGSVIVSLADRPVRSPQELTQLVAGGPTDRPVPLRYVLPGGAEKQAEVVLQALELPLEQALVGPPSPQPALPPQLQPGPQASTSRRPESARDVEAVELRREVGRLRGLLDAVERRLERLGSR